MILVDTSAIVALNDTRDPNHQSAVGFFETIVASAEPILIHNYTISETVSVLQRRKGFQDAARFLESIAAWETHWVSPDEHHDACALFVSRGLRRLSLADCVSFVVMRRLAIFTAFAFDSDFTREGFKQYGL